ncbi:MAG TPA: hypothetical protein VFO63_09055 [Blastocatellia bacterium]|nr:hypothetical protein [Blastocatellia bacterium]
MNKRIQRPLIAIAALLLTGGFQLAPKRTAAQPWVEFHSKEGAFSILMPQQPTRKADRTETASGTIESVLFTANSDRTSYQIGYFDLPFAPSEDDQINKALDRGRDGGLANSKGELISETPITLDGHLGREIKAKLLDGFLVSRVYLVKQRLYAIIILMRGEVASADTTHFLDSFRLAKIKSRAELAGWVEFSSVEGGFTVWMPEKPVEEPIPEETLETLQKAGMSMQMFIHVTPKGPGFTVIYSDIEGDFSDPKEKEEFLDGVRSGQVNEKGSKLLSEKAIWLDSHPGREFMTRTPTTIIRTRAYVVGNRSYQIIFITPLNVRDKKNDCETFFDSFKLVNRQKA